MLRGNRLREQIREQVAKLRLWDPLCKPVILVPRKGVLYDDKIAGAKVMEDPKLPPDKVLVLANAPEGLK